MVIERVWTANRLVSLVVKWDWHADKSCDRVVLASRVVWRNRSAARYDVWNWERSVDSDAVPSCDVIRSDSRTLMVERAVASCCLRAALLSESVVQPVANR